MSDKKQDVSERCSTLEKIGSGAFGGVYVVDNRVLSPNPIALKVYIASKENSGLDRLFANLFDVKEMDVMSRFKHTNLVSALAVHTPGAEYKEYAISMPLADSTLTRTRQFSMEEKLGFITDITNAVFFLHSNGVIHRDLKPDNYVLFHSKSLKLPSRAALIDFSIVSYHDTRNPHITFANYGEFYTAGYRPPEMHISEKDHLGCSEIWALGMTFFEILLGVHPYYVMYPRDPCVTDNHYTQWLIKHFKNALTANNLIKSLRPYFGTYAVQCVDLLSGMLTPIPGNRSSIMNVVKHPLLEPFQTVRSLKASVVPWPTITSKDIKDAAHGGYFSFLIKNEAENLPYVPVEAYFLAADLYYRAFAVTSKNAILTYVCFTLAVSIVKFDSLVQNKALRYLLQLTDYNKVDWNAVQRDIFRELNGVIYPESVYHACRTREELKYMVDVWLTKTEYAFIDRNRVRDLLPVLPIPSKDQEAMRHGTYNKNIGMANLLK
jgi:serine/threonine protein kinase